MERTKHKHSSAKNKKEDKQEKQRLKTNKRENKNQCSCPRCCYVPLPKMGACCMDGICSIQEEQVCLQNGGYWMGTDTRCWEVKCPGDPVGACCMPRGCAMTRERYCPGMWMGPYTSCEACNPALATPITTYGGPVAHVSPMFPTYEYGTTITPNYPFIPLPNYWGQQRPMPPTCGNPLFGRPCGPRDGGF